MKFGDQFKLYKIPEFDEYYLNYDALKFIIEAFVKEKIKKEPVSFNKNSSTRRVTVLK